MKKYLFTALMALMFHHTVFAQANTQDQVHLFQTFFEDASMVKTPYGQASLRFGDYDNASTVHIPLQFVLPTGDHYEMNFGVEAGFLSYNPEVGDGESGLTDIKVVGRYNFPAGRTKVAAGGYLTLPVGNEDVGQSNFNIGAFGALRHPINPKFTITGAVMIESLEQQQGAGDDRETALLLAFGTIYKVDPRFHLIGEINLKTGVDYGLLSFGVDYVVTSQGSLRGALGLGMDDAAPDLQLLLGYHHYFD